MSASPNLVHDVVALPATELVALLRTGQLSARETVKAYISRIEAVNPKINAVVVPLFDEALEQADRLDSARLNGEELGPMHGLPVSIKESIEIAGTPSTLGLTERATTRAIEDGYQVQQLKRAGAVVLCKTNVALLLKAYETDNPVYGRTNNPWNLDRAPGGSSGGEGALVASRGAGREPARPRTVGQARHR